MGKLKRIGAAAAALVMCCACLTGCSDTRYILTYNNDKKVNSGVYLYNMLTQMQQQMYIMSYTQQSSESSGEIDYFSQKVDGKDFATYISDKSNEGIHEYAAVVAQCEKLGIKLTSEETKQISDGVNDAWTSNGDMFEEMGISKESMKQAETESQLRQKLFDYYYAEKGKEEVKQDEMTKYLEDNYVRYKTITIAKSTETDKDKKKKADEESEKTLEKYLKKAQKTDFDGFDAVIDAYNKETNPQTETTEGTDDSSAAATETESSAADSSADTSSAAENSSAADDTSSVAETTAESSAADSTESSTAASGGTLQATDESTADSDNSLVTFDPDSVASSDTSSSTESTTDTTGDTTGEEAEEDPYANETMYNFSKMDDETKKSATGKLIEKIKGLKVDKAEKYEDDDSYYIVIKGDVSKRTESYIESNKESLLEEMKGDDFDKKISDWQKDFGIKENTASFKRYTPKDVYDRWSEYLKDNSEANQ